MIITAEILKKIAPGCKKANYNRLHDLAHWMNEWLPDFGIDTAQEVRHFLAQCAHESDSFNALEEYASGNAYEGAIRLGNNKPGDGVKYKGKGIIQTTGKSNYMQLDMEVDQYFSPPISFTKTPELLKQPNYAVWSACIFWDKRDLNVFANMPDTAEVWVKKLGKNLSPLEYITWRVNGGFNGFTERALFYERAKTIII